MFEKVAITIFDYVTIVPLCKYNDIGFDYDNHEKVIQVIVYEEEVKNNIFLISIITIAQIFTGNLK